MDDSSRNTPMQCVGFFVEETGGRDYLLKTSSLDNDQRKDGIVRLFESMDVKFCWYAKEVTTVFGNFTRALEVSRALKGKLGIDSQIFAGVFNIYFDPTTIPNNDGKRSVENANPSQQKFCYGVLMSRGMAEFASKRLEQERHDGESNPEALQNNKQVEADSVQKQSIQKEAAQKGGNLKAMDYAFRPANYLMPSGFRNLVIQNVKGEKRREIILDLIEKGEFDEAFELLSEINLPESLKNMIGAIHPQFMGGEYLPNLKKNECEIARVAMESVTADVISIRARFEDNNIFYRIVDEYKTRFKLAIKSSTQPLTLSEIIRQIDGSWHDKDYQGLIFGLLQYKIDEEGVAFDELEEQYRNFFSVSSPYYSQISEYYEATIAEWFFRKSKEIDA